MKYILVVLGIIIVAAMASVVILLLYKWKLNSRRDGNQNMMEMIQR